MSTVRRLPRARAWLRAFVLLLALCLPAAPADGPASPVAAAAEVVEYDAVDPVLRPAAARRADRPTAPPPRPAPLPRPRVRPEPPRTPPALPVLRSVVLRC
ncbi:MULTISPECIES: hypothetical protein [unclassified Streptomyces]|uniref:hypothetical protein n=1 Tax=unclassified Streptomyces TaxID=2593676 RepID=UPI001661FBBA|nr:MULTISPECIES: hypothetical protein [unclassified Streptomyces]MBD0838601.1 hypothetical protein [Streptomyces sp. TRM68416]